MRNLKKIIALVAVFAMLVSSVAFAGTFGDVAETDNYAKAIELLYDLEIVTGDDNDGDGVMDFRPEDTITRAEVTALIARIQGLNAVAQAPTEFNDVPADHWASGYVGQAATQGIVNGYGDGNFGPEDNVTYEQMIKMLMCTLGYEPFAADAGGFPTGYIAAATRYGVIDGVVGGGIGVEASRGMVAQMIYNAINTPLMDAVTYGADKEFGIYDGVNYKLMTLLTRDLKLIKFTGVVTANSLSGAIDTTARKMVKVYPYQTKDNTYYLTDYTTWYNNGATFQIATQNLYQGDVNCDPYLGHPVEVYAKKMSNFENNFTVVAISEQPVNSEVSFNCDQFVRYGATPNVVEYLKDVNSNVEIAKTIQDGATVIYNGIPEAQRRWVSAGTDGINGTDDDVYAARINDFLGGLITANSNLSGNVTLLDTDNDPAYDIVKINVAVTGVVKEVTNKGQVKFMRNINAPTGQNIKLVFDENNTDTIINLTKNGEAIDYTELKKWDVVSILWNGTKEVYDVTVLDEGNYVDGAISVAKGNGDVVLTDGNTYEVASNVYGITATEPGLSGRFYIDAYGKIVALDDSVEIEGLTTKVDQYAYVLAAKVVEGNWDGDKIVQVKLLDMSGEVYEAQLASKVTLINFDQTMPGVVGAAGLDGNGAVKKNFVATLNEATSITDLEGFANGLVNRIVAYQGNDAGKVKTIALQANRNSERDLALIASGNAEYNADARTFKNGIAVNEDTKVFFIAPGKNATGVAGNVAYADATYVSDAENCAVGTINSLIDNNQTYQVYGFAPDSNDEAQVVVVLNETGRMDAASNVAVIDSVGTTIINGNDTVYSVAYYQNGELKTATTKPDMVTAGVIAGAKRGDIVKLTVDNGIITHATSVLSFTAVALGDYAGNAYAGELYGMDATSTPKFTLGTPNTAAQEGYFFGAIEKFTNNGTAILKQLKADGSGVDAVEMYAKERDNTNVVVFDINMKADYRLSVGSLGDADVDDELAVGGYNVYDKANNVLTATPAYGMMDYVFVRTYNNREADIVVFKNYDFYKAYEYDVR